MMYQTESSWHTSGSSIRRKATGDLVLQEQSGNRHVEEMEIAAEAPAEKHQLETPEMFDARTVWRRVIRAANARNLKRR